AQLQVRLTSGQLQSIGLEALLAGGNLAALGDGSPDRWEVFQFGSAVLVERDTYLLGDLLRGQQGSDVVMPDLWPEGSYMVLLDGTSEQIGLPASARGLARHYRIGPAARPLDDPSFTAARLAFDGIGLKPYAPVHLRARQVPDGALKLS